MTRYSVSSRRGHVRTFCCFACFICFCTIISTRVRGRFPLACLLSRRGGEELQTGGEESSARPAPPGHVAQGEAARAGWDSCLPPAFLPSCVCCWFHGLSPSSVSSVSWTHRAGRETRGSLLVSDGLLLSCLQLTWIPNI